MDLNGDQWHDFFVGVNDDRPLTFLNSGSSPGSMVEVRLVGLRGNATAVGARVTLQVDGGTTQTAELYAGSGYLSQSASALYFGTLGKDVKSISVRWPDGTRSTHAWEGRQKYIVLKHPGIVD